MEGCEICPQCLLVPDPKISDDGSIELACARHGHMALGDNLSMAIRHWNKYITWTVLTQKGNPELERRLR